MSYLNLPLGIPDFSKAVISFWFRIPKESMEACANLAEERFAADQAATQEEKESPNSYVMPRLNGMVPLIAFGPMFEGYKIKTISEQDITYKIEHKFYVEHAGWHDLSEPDIRKTSSGPKFIQKSNVLVGPSYIGVKSVWKYDDQGEKTDQFNTALFVHLQMGNNGSGSWVFTRSKGTQSDYVQNHSPTAGNPSMPTEVAWDGNACSKGGVFPGGANETTSTLIDETNFFIEANGPESFTASISPENEDGEGIQIEPDKWHHALISFDLEHSMIARGTKVVGNQPDCSEDGSRPEFKNNIEKIQTIEDPCKMWIALDDVNDTNVMGLKTDEGGDEAGATWQYGLGPNDITTPNCMYAAGAINSAIEYSKGWGISWVLHIRRGNTSFGIPTFNYQPGPIPSTYPIGIPCVPDGELVGSIYRVEMAELQMWTGAALDFEEEQNRRIFIDYKKEGDNTLRPVDPNIAQEFIGRRPDVMLHGSNNWKAGKNTGTTGVDDEGKEVEGGRFQPTARIEAYKPDPSLEVT